MKASIACVVLFVCLLTFAGMSWAQEQQPLPAAPPLQQPVAQPVPERRYQNARAPQAQPESGWRFFGQQVDAGGNAGGKAKLDQRVFVLNEKNPGYAFVLSLAIPGAGLMYDGEVGWGLGIFFTSVAWYALAMFTTPYLLIPGGIEHLAQLIWAPIRANQVNQSYLKGNMEAAVRLHVDESLTLAPTMRGTFVVARF